MKNSNTIRRLPRLIQPVVWMSCLAVSVSAGRASTIAFTPNGGSQSEGQQITYGLQFTPLVDITVDSLAFIDSGEDGLTKSHQVGIWDNTGTLVTSATVTTANSTLDGPVDAGSQFRFTPITPVTLSSGETYTLGGYENQALSDIWYDGVGALTSTDSSLLQLGQSVFRIAGFGEPNQSGGTLDFVIANFAFDVAAPEPSTSVLIGSALIALGWRRLRGGRKARLCD